MKKITKKLIFLFIATMFLSGTAQAQVMYGVGDVVSLSGHQYTLDRFLNGEAIWKSTKGKLYVVESAKRQDKENYILTEIELGADANTIIKWKSALIIGSKLPFSLDGNGELQQVDLIQKIEDGKILERSVYRTGSSGYPYPVTGLVYYHIGDTSTFAGKELKLDQFINDKGLWKDHNNRLYDVSIAKEKGTYQYVIKEEKGSIKAKEGALSHANLAKESLLPPYKIALHGSNEIRVKNPNEFDVTVALRAEDRGKNFAVAAKGLASVFVPNGKYQIYFVYSNKPDALFQGDDFTLNGNGIEIQIIKVVSGNYGIRQVK